MSMLEPNHDLNSRYENVHLKFQALSERVEKLKEVLNTAIETTTLIVNKISAEPRVD